MSHQISFKVVKIILLYNKFDFIYNEFYLLRVALYLKYYQKKKYYYYCLITLTNLPFS